QPCVFMNDQTEAVPQQRLQHQPDGFRRRFERRFGIDIEPVELQPVRSAKDGVGIDVPCGFDQIQHGGFAQILADGLRCTSAASKRGWLRVTFCEVTGACASNAEALNIAMKMEKTAPAAA